MRFLESCVLSYDLQITKTQPTVELRMPSWSNVETALLAMIPGSDIWPEEDSARNRHSKWTYDGEPEKATLRTVSVVNDFFKPTEGSFFPLFRTGTYIPRKPVQSAQSPTQIR